MNIKKTNEALMEKQEKKPEKEEPPPPTKESTNGLVPMSDFMSPPDKNVIPTSNRWFPIVQSWAKTYREIATQEKNIRNFSLSEKYSEKAALWAKRALKIKDLIDEKAIIYVEIWLSQIDLPDLPQEPQYYTGKDVFKKISDTRMTLNDLNNIFCLIYNGVQVVPALAYLEISTDLVQQKTYARAQYKIQNSLSILGDIKKEKTFCENQIQEK